MPLDPAKRFILKFGILLILFYVAITPAPVDAMVISRFSGILATLSGAVLNLLGQHVAVKGTVIAGTSFAVDIRNGCNGIEAVIFLCAGIFAFRAPLKARLVGALVSCGVIQALNILRIVSLYLIGVYLPGSFDTFHLAVWQSVIFGAAVLMFTVWTSRAQQMHADAAP